jgi:hypothetical protein
MTRAAKPASKKDASEARRKNGVYLLADLLQGPRKSGLRDAIEQQLTNGHGRKSFHFLGRLS